MSVRWLLVMAVMLACSSTSFAQDADDEPEGSPSLSDVEPLEERRQRKEQNKKRADELFQEAHAALDAGDWDTACSKFRESMRYDISVSTQLNIARCREHEGELVEAWNDYNRARILNRETADEARRQALGDYLEKSVAAIERRLPKVRVIIQHPPAELTIFCDGTQVAQGAAGEPFPVNPGEHKIAVLAPGHRTELRTVELTEGQTLEVAMDLQVGENPTPKAAPPPPPPPMPDEPDSRRPRNEGIAPWVWPVGAAGVVAMGAAIGVAVLSVSARSKLGDGCSKAGGTFECPDDQFTQNEIDGLVRDSNGGLAGALALGAVGVAGIASAAAGIATSKSDAGDDVSLSLRPLVAPTPQGLALGGAMLDARF